MLFIVKGSVSKRGYMRDQSEETEVMHPVEANSAEEAEELFKEHYREMSHSYDVSYSAYVIDVFETISRKK